MDEIIENIRQRAKGLYEEKKAILKLRNTTIAKLENEIRDISKEQDMIGDKNDDFYQYLESQKSAKKEEFSRLVEDCLKKAKILEKRFPIEKEIITNYLNNLNDSKTPEDTRFRINENFTIDNIENFYQSFSSEITESKEAETVEETETTVAQETEPVNEVEDTTIEQDSKPVAEVEDTTIEQDSEPVAVAEDSAIEQDPEPVNEVVDKINQAFTMGNVKTNNGKIEGVNILYKASTNQYVVENPYTKGQKIINRNALKKVDKTLVAEKIGRDIDDLKYVHTDILQALHLYDKENATNTSTKYFKITRMGKAKKARKEEMKEAHISITYDLTGLYDSVEIGDKDELLEIANLSKRGGIATVKKGIKVTMRESLEKIGSRFESLLPFSNNEQIKYLEPARYETKIEDSKHETELTADQHKQKTATPVNTEPYKQEIETPVAVNTQEQETVASVSFEQHKQESAEAKMKAELELRQKELEQARDAVKLQEQEAVASVHSEQHKQELAEAKMKAELELRQKALEQARDDYYRLQHDLADIEHDFRKITPCSPNKDFAMQFAATLKTIQYKQERTASKEKEDVQENVQEDSSDLGR